MQWGRRGAGVIIRRNFCLAFGLYNWGGGLNKWQFTVSFASITNAYEMPCMLKLPPNLRIYVTGQF